MSPDIFEYVIYMIHACANKWEISPSEVYQTLKKSKGLDYLVKYYDLNHTQSTEYIVSEIEKFLTNRGISVC